MMHMSNQIDIVISFIFVLLLKELPLPEKPQKNSFITQPATKSTNTTT